VSDPRIQDLDAERGVVGAVLASRGAVLGVCQDAGLTSEAFTDRRNGLVFDVMARMVGEARQVDQLSVAVRLREEGRLEDVGGQDFLSCLVDAVPTVAHAWSYVQAVKVRWARRRVAEACRMAAEDALGSDDGEDPMDRAVGRLMGSGVHGARRSKEEVVRAARELWDRAAGQGFSGVPMPFASVMHMTGGCPTGIMSIMAGRRGDGKSTFARNWMVYAAEHGFPVAHVLLEDTEERFWTQAAAGRWCIDATEHLNGEASEEERAAMESLVRRVSELPIEVYAGEPRSDEVAGWVARQVAERKVRLVVCDNWTQLEPGVSIRDPMERDRYLSNVMTQLARRLDVHMCWLAHVTKENEFETRKLRLTDIRGSGSLVDRARQVWLIDPSDPKDDKSVRWLIHTAKNNNGRTGVTELNRHVALGCWTEAGKLLTRRSASTVLAELERRRMAA